MNMIRVSMCLAAALSLTALAGPGKDRTGPARWEQMDPEARAERVEAMGRRARMATVVAIADALSLTEADALKLSDKLKAFEERRAPIRQQMTEAMRSVKAAADGDAAALAQVDASIQQVLDGRARMAALDKELFAVLAEGYSPQQRAKLAMVLARLNLAGKLKGRAGQRAR